MDNRSLAIANLFANAALGYFRAKAQNQLQQSQSQGKMSEDAYRFMEKQVNNKELPAEQRNSVYQQMRAINPNLPDIKFSGEQSIGDRVGGILSQDQKLNYNPTSLPSVPQQQVTLGDFGGIQQPQANIQPQEPTITGPTSKDKYQALLSLAAEQNVPKNIIDEIAVQGGLIPEEKANGNVSAAKIRLYRELKPAQKKQASEIDSWLKYYYDLTKRGEQLGDDEKGFVEQAASMLEKLYNKKPLNKKEFMQLRKAFNNRRAFPKSSSIEDIFRNAGLLPGSEQPEQPTDPFSEFGGQRKQ